jgi:hypothetical protein
MGHAWNRSCRSLSQTYGEARRNPQEGQTMDGTQVQSEGTFDETLGKRISRAVRDWTGQLVDVSGRNTLLCCRDLKAGTLDLAGAGDVALEQLLAGHTVRSWPHSSHVTPPRHRPQWPAGNVRVGSGAWLRRSGRLRFVTI